MAEAAGLALGAIPLIISALEYYPKAKKIARQFYGFRAARTAELLLVERYRAEFRFHLDNLLNPLRDEGILDAKEAGTVSRDPATLCWTDTPIKEALGRRLAGEYTTYLGMLNQVELLMVELLKQVKVDHVAFKKYVATKTSTSSNTNSQNVQDRVTACFQKLSLQTQIAGHALQFHSRTDTFKQLAESIEQLKGFLAAADNSTAYGRLRSGVQAQRYGVSESLRTFWLRADNIWAMIQDHMKCQCRPQHCARLIFTKYYNLQESLDLVFLFDKKHPEAAAPWKRQTLKIHNHEENCSCGNYATSVQGTSTTPAITVQSATSGSTAVFTSTRSTLASAGARVESHGLCKTLLDHGKGFVCLGAVHCDNDGRQYHFLAEQDSAPESFISLSATLEKGFRPAFGRIARIRLAATLAAAHMRYYHTPWLPGTWSLRDIYFPKDNKGGTKPAYDLPYIIAEFSASSSVQTQYPAEAQGFWTLGIVLLELCFGYPLEDHYLWSVAGSTRNPKDPLHRKTIAVDWAKEVEDEVEGPQYSGAVKWCLCDAPTYVRDDKWRDPFVSKVLGPLQEYARTISESRW